MTCPRQQRSCLFRKCIYVNGSVRLLIKWPSPAAGFIPDVSAIANWHFNKPCQTDGSKIEIFRAVPPRHSDSILGPIGKSSPLVGCPPPSSPFRILTQTGALDVNNIFMSETILCSNPLGSFPSLGGRFCSVIGEKVPQLCRLRGPTLAGFVGDHNDQVVYPGVGLPRSLP
jgi:hypothetical protein